MSEAPPGGSRGLIESLSNLAATLVAMAHTRLDLLSADLEEERDTNLSVLLLALTAMFCLGVGLVLSTILLVEAFWDTHRFLMLGMIAGFFLLGGIAVLAFAIHKTRTKPRLFSASLSEFAKDRQQLVSRP